MIISCEKIKRDWVLVPHYIVTSVIKKKNNLTITTDSGQTKLFSYTDLTRKMAESPKWTSIFTGKKYILLPYKRSANYNLTLNKNNGTTWYNN